MKQLAVFASGYGSNLQSILNAARRGHLGEVRVAVVVSDRPQAHALVRARRAGIPAVVVAPDPLSGSRARRRVQDRRRYDHKLLAALRPFGKIDFVCLAGFMRILGPTFVRAFRRRILNIHPALLPAFKGAHAIRDAYAYGVAVTGPTVHLVDERVDHGPIILQEAVRIRSRESLKSLEARIHRAEHRVYPQAIRLILRRKLRLVGRRVV